MGGSVIESDIGRRNLPGGRAWGVVFDGSILPVHPTAAVRAGAAKHLPLLVSSNRDEIKMFEQQAGFAPADQDALLADIRHAGFDSPEPVLEAYRARHPEAELTELRSRFLADAIYCVPADRLARAQTEAGGTAYRALFAADPFGPGVGTPHGMDIAFVFDLLDGNHMGTEANYAVRDDLHRAWALFAEMGQPGWPAYDAGAETYTRVFAAPATVTAQPPRDQAVEHWHRP